MLILAAYVLVLTLFFTHSFLPFIFHAKGAWFLYHTPL